MQHSTVTAMPNSRNDGTIFWSSEGLRRKSFVKAVICSVTEYNKRNKTLCTVGKSVQDIKDSYSALAGNPDEGLLDKIPFLIQCTRNCLVHR